MNKKICAVCAKPLSIIDLQSESYTFYRCSNCSLVQIRPFPGIQKRTSFYSYKNPITYAEKKNKQIYFISKIPFGSLLLQKYTEGCYQNRYEKIVKLQKNGRILDIGCGDGYFLRKFPKKSWQISGVELNKNLAKDAQKKTPYGTIVTKAIESVSFKKNSFDIVTLWHVFEHLHNPLIILKSIRHIIAPQGYLVIEVPHGNSIYKDLFSKQWQLLLLPQHLFFWTKKSITKALNETGFEIIEISYPGVFNISGASSCASFLQARNYSFSLSIVIAILFIPICLIINSFLFRKRDNIIVIAKPA